MRYGLILPGLGCGLAWFLGFPEERPASLFLMTEIDLIAKGWLYPAWLAGMRGFRRGFFMDRDHHVMGEKRRKRQFNSYTKEIT